MYGLIGLMGEKYGAPYDTYPFSCMEFGRAAIAESGGTCGCLIAGAMIISLFWGKRQAVPMQAELLRWYETTALPIYKPARGSTPISGRMTPSRADSILCHISVARWCKANFAESGSPNRAERCARLAADVARKTGELIFAAMDGPFQPKLDVSDLQKSCAVEGCHGPTSDKWANTNWLGTMECQPCHTGAEAVLNKTVNHP